eukprot:SAG11_NODE_1686_length_4448_cov_8.906415_1_plen_320_part_00
MDESELARTLTKDVLIQARAAGIKGVDRIVNQRNALMKSQSQPPRPPRPKADMTPDAEPPISPAMPLLGLGLVLVVVIAVAVQLTQGGSDDNTGSDSGGTTQAELATRNREIAAAVKGEPWGSDKLASEVAKALRKPESPPITLVVGGGPDTAPARSALAQLLQRRLFADGGCEAHMLTLAGREMKGDAKLVVVRELLAAAARAGCGALLHITGAEKADAAALHWLEPYLNGEEATTPGHTTLFLLEATLNEDDQIPTATAQQTQSEEGKKQDPRDRCNGGGDGDYACRKMALQTYLVAQWRRPAIFGRIGTHGAVLPL